MSDYMSSLRRLCARQNIYTHVTSPDTRRTEEACHNDVKKNYTISDHDSIVKDTAVNSYTGHFQFDSLSNDVLDLNSRAVSSNHKTLDGNDKNPRLVTCPENSLRHTSPQEASLAGRRKEGAFNTYPVDERFCRSQKSATVDARRDHISINIHDEDITCKPTVAHLKDHDVARCQEDGGMGAVVIRDNSKRSTKRSLVVSQSLPLSPPSPTADRESRRLSDLKMAVDKVHTDLITLQKTDQDLAKHLLNMYHEIRLMKVKSKCVLHQELLFDAMDDAEDEDQMPDMCDAPKKSMNRILLNHGVTWLNINARRFSCS